MWTNLEGKKISAEVKKMTSQEVVLRLNTGKVYKVPIASLIQEDQDYLRGLKEEALKAEDKSQELNEVLGYSFFLMNQTLWHREASEMASNFNIPKESQTESSSSYRRYFTREAARSQTDLKSMLSTISIDGDLHKKVSSVNMVFANVGDSGKASSRELSKLLKQDYKVIESRLTEVLGPASKQRYGEGNLRRSVQRWDYTQHVFILSYVKKKYVGLEIIPKAFADAGGKTVRVSDIELRDRLEKNIVKEKTGDVYLKNLPMIDQGPKGYCVPATAASVLSYMGVDADMYILANECESSGEGGTSISVLVKTLKVLAGGKGRSIRSLNLNPLKFSAVKRQINKGYPILWVMRSTNAYNASANKRTQLRAKTDWNRYVKLSPELLKQNLGTIGNEEQDSAHMCAIIGYNEETQEIAVRDSWGPLYALRWIHVREANEVSYSGYIISR